MSLEAEAKDCLRVYLNKPSSPQIYPKHQAEWTALIKQHTQNGFIAYPFMFAWAQYLEKEFFSKGVSPDTVVDGGLALRAAYRSSLPEMQLAVKYGQNLNLRTSRGLHQTALHRVASRGSTALVEYLMKNGASPLVLSSEGTSPLWVALAKWRFTTAGAMLKLDPSLRSKIFTEKNSQGRLALEENFCIMSDYATSQSWYPFREKFVTGLLKHVGLGLDETLPLHSTIGTDVCIRDFLADAPPDFLVKLGRLGFIV